MGRLAHQPPPAGPSVLIALLAALLAVGLSSMAFTAWWVARARRRERLLEQEYLDAYRVLRVKTGVRPEQTRFSYRPATRELKLDAAAARLHGVPDASAGTGRFVTLDGWHELPTAGGAAGWIDDALTEGLAIREPVECEYRARTAGQADRYFLLNAVPLRTADVLVGALAENRPAQAASGQGEMPGPPPSATP